MEPGGATGRVKAVRANWSTAILVCGKCSKKIGGGFGPKGGTRLAKALRGYVGGSKGRKAAVGIVEVKCLGICPKNAVTVINAAMPREWLLIRAGDDLAETAAALGIAVS